VDANAILIDPQVPPDISRQLVRAPARRLVPFGAPAPAVVPPPRRRWKRVFTPEGRKAIAAAVATVVFFVATIVAFVSSVSAHAPEAAILGIVTAVFCINRFVATAPAMEAAQRAGWRQRPLTANPDHPAWDGLHAVTAYHRRYVAPARDMDAEARDIWTRAVDAAGKLEESEVVRLGLVDSVLPER
jgi:hypothetical protein